MKVPGFNEIGQIISRMLREYYLECHLEFGNKLYIHYTIVDVKFFQMKENLNVKSVFKVLIVAYKMIFCIIILMRIIHIAMSQLICKM